MNFVADESCAGPVVRALREAGHDVLAVAEIAKGATDETILRFAMEQSHLLITEDRDFGELVFARDQPSAGVILVRIHSGVRRAKTAIVLEAVTKSGARLHGAFTVIEAGRVRISNRP